MDGSSAPPARYRTWIRLLGLRLSELGENGSSSPRQRVRGIYSLNRAFLGYCIALPLGDWLVSGPSRCKSGTLWHASIPVELTAARISRPCLAVNPFF